MKITFNKRFELLLEDYGLPSDFSFQIGIPDYVQEILNGEILVTEDGATRETINKAFTKQKKNGKINLLSRTT